VVWWAVLWMLAGCAQVPRQTNLMAKVPGVDMSTAELRERVLELGRRQAALIEEGVGDTYESTEDPKTRRAAMRWGLAVIPDVQEASLNGDPLIALADLWALAFQTEAFAANGRGGKYLGEARGFVERTARQMARESEELAGQVFGPDVPRRRAQVKRWADANPITAATFARPTASAVLAGTLSDQRPSARRFIASTEERLAQLDARLEMMNKTLLNRIRWTMQLLIEDALGTADVASMVGELQQFADLERQRINGDIDRQRVEIFDQVSRERAQIFQDVASERTAITGVANQMLAQANADARRLIDRTLLRLGVGAAVLIVLAALAAWIVWHTSRGPRGRVSSRSWPRPAPGSTLP
jgi:hypothetical protein